MVANAHSTPLKRRKSILEPPIFADFDEFEEPSLLVAVMTYLSYAVLIVFGHLRDFMTRVGLEKSHRPVEKGNLVCSCALQIHFAILVPKSSRPHPQGFVPLYADFESFYTRHLYRRIRDCWNRPITGVPGGYMYLLERKSSDFNWTFEYVEG
jgi:serine palmitoyltransferase